MLNTELIKASLGGSSLISNCYFFDEISSTNDFAKSLTGENNILVVTEYQTAGHGRFNRKWESEKGLNLTFTIKKKIDILPKRIQFVNFFFSYYLIDGLRKYLNGLDPKPHFEIYIKWPNDVILNSKKVSGILLENNLSDMEFIIGFGINVNQEKFNEDSGENAASLKNLIKSEINLDRSLLLICLLNHFEKNINLLLNGHFDIIYKFWRGSNFLIGKDILFETPGHIQKNAKVIDFTEDGGIEIESENKKVTYYSGDIKILKGWQ